MHGLLLWKKIFINKASPKGKSFCLSVSLFIQRWMETSPVYIHFGGWEVSSLSMSIQIQEKGQETFKSENYNASLLMWALVYQGVAWAHPNPIKEQCLLLTPNLSKSFIGNSTPLSHPVFRVSHLGKNYYYLIALKANAFFSYTKEIITYKLFHKLNKSKVLKFYRPCSAKSCLQCSEIQLCCMFMLKGVGKAKFK